MNTLLLAGIDVGSPHLTGEMKQLPDGFEVMAGGKDIWGTRDEFHFAQTQLTGNFSLSVRIVSLTMADVYTKAGLMLRTSLEAGAEHAFLLAFGDNQPRNKNNGGIEFQYRLKSNEACIGIYPPQPLPLQPDFPVKFPAVWLKLSRDGKTITGEYSRDGEHWQTFSVHRQSFPDAVYVGLAVTSHNGKQAVRSVFSDLCLRKTPGEI
jgi:hypothetical protein